ncbi:MAG: hypothetical protein OXI93_02045 [Bryobacterales bacterium]|nr:hypothetical protein [Bryobacterales bacterium]
MQIKEVRAGLRSCRDSGGGIRAVKLTLCAALLTAAALAQQQGGYRIDTFAGLPDVWDNGPATEARLDLPSRASVDGEGNLFIADLGNHRIRKVDSSGSITTVAGSEEYGYGGDGGRAIAAQLYRPSDVAVDGEGNLYIADRGNDRIRKVDSSGVITTIAGTGAEGFGGDGGQAVNAQLNSPVGVALDGSGKLYIADRDNHRIRKVDSSGVITTIAGTGAEGFNGDGGQATAARLDNPFGVVLDGSGNLFIADAGNDRIRKVDSSGVITTIAGSAKILFGGDGGRATAAQLYLPSKVAVDGAGNLYIADTRNYRVRKVDAGGTITTLAGTGAIGFSGDGGPAAAAQLAFPRGVALDSDDNLFIADSVHHRIRKVDSSGVITTIAGTGVEGFSGDGGQAVNAQLHSPWGVAVDGAGNLYIADRNNHRIRKVDSSGVITTIAGTGAESFGGDDGQAVNAQINSPVGVALDGAGNLYIADRSNHRIRKVDSSGVITTVVGSGERGFGGDGGPAATAQLAFPHGVAVDGAGNLYIADSSNHRIRKVDSSGVIRTIAGTGERGFRGNGVLATNAWLDLPFGVAVNGSGNIYIADSSHRIRLLTTLPPPPPPPPSQPGEPPSPPSDRDDDGFSNEVESGAPNDGDGNGDGVPDARQPHVASFPTVVRNSPYVTLEVPSRIRITDIRALLHPPAEPPTGAAFPIGFLDFRLRSVGRRQAVAVSLYLPPGLEGNSYWKYGPTPDNAEPHWYPFDYDGETGAQFRGPGQIVLHFIDGDRGDDDLRRNGVIADVGGPALTVPALAPLSIDLPGEDTVVGLALHNPTPAANAVGLSIVDAAGATLRQVALESALAGKGQQAGLVCELLDCGEENGAAAVISRGRQGHLQSLFLAGDRGGRKLDGVSGEFETAQRLYFPIVDAGRHGATLLFVFNPRRRETEVSFRLHRQDGTVASTATRAAAGGGFVSETVAELFGGGGGGEQGYVEARTARSVLGFAFLGDEESYAALAARPLSGGSARSMTLYAPHFRAGGDSATTLYMLSSLANHVTRVRIRAFNDRGETLAEAERELAAAADSLLLVDEVGELLQLPPSTRQDGGTEGYLQLDFELVSGPLLPFAKPQAWGAVALARSGARTVLPLVEAGGGSRRTSFLQVAHGDEGDDNMFTALSILNPGPETALATVRVFDREGRQSGRRILSIAPGVRHSGELDESSLFGPAFRQVGGHLQVHSDRPVISFALFGDRDGQFLAAIPGRPGIP